MKRLAFLASLFGFGAAATTWDNVRWKMGLKALNGQCPVCGMMSAPIDAAIAPRMVFAKDGDTPTKFYWSVAEPIRCLRCNACFWRDSK